MLPMKRAAYLNIEEQNAELDNRTCNKYRRLVSNYVDIGQGTAHRRLLKAVSQNVLESFASRCNNLDGFWALSQYVKFLKDEGKSTLVFDLKNGKTTPESSIFSDAARYYWQATLYIMRANKIPESWLHNAPIVFSLMDTDRCKCEIVLESDHGKLFSHSIAVFVLPH